MRSIELKRLVNLMFNERGTKHRSYHLWIPKLRFCHIRTCSQVGDCGGNTIKPCADANDPERTSPENFTRARLFDLLMVRLQVEIPLSSAYPILLGEASPQNREKN
jgi:hypothetical protein